MIENFNASTNPGESVEFKKYIGVGKVNVVAVNPDNAFLRTLGWNIPEGADEPKYVITKEVNGKPQKSARVRFMVQVTDLEDKPVVPVDFWVRPELFVNRDETKCKIIDSFGRTAWATRDEFKAHKIPVYSNNMSANIAGDYKGCHRGEEEIVKFLFKYLNITPLQIYSRATNGYVDSEKPGKLTIDNWAALCNGDVSEIVSYIKLQPENRMGVIFGVKNTDDNKTYQTFLNTYYLGNGVRPDNSTGEYASARKAIDKYFERAVDTGEIFAATPIKEYSTIATTNIEDNSKKLFDDDGNLVDNIDDDDMPF